MPRALSGKTLASVNDIEKHSHMRRYQHTALKVQASFLGSIQHALFFKETGEPLYIDKLVISDAPRGPLAPAHPPSFTSTGLRRLHQPTAATGAASASQDTTSQMPSPKSAETKPTALTSPRVAGIPHTWRAVSGTLIAGPPHSTTPLLEEAAIRLRPATLRPAPPASSTRDTAR